MIDDMLATGRVFLPLPSPLPSRLFSCLRKSPAFFFASSAQKRRTLRFGVFISPRGALRQEGPAAERKADVRRRKGGSGGASPWVRRGEEKEAQTGDLPAEQEFDFVVRGPQSGPRRPSVCDSTNRTPPCFFSRDGGCSFSADYLSKRSIRVIDLGHSR